MAERHPYSASGAGGLMQAVGQLRKSFPPQFNADSLKKLAIAPNNESYVVNILRFIGVIDADCKKTENAANIFSKHEDRDFQTGFAELIKDAYADLFALHGDDVWQLNLEKLISFFRGADHTSELVGRRQANTFQALASLAGHSFSTSAPRVVAGPLKSVLKKRKNKNDDAQGSEREPSNLTDKATLRNSTIRLTVRVEVNLPVAPDQETYDRIFRSIKENLLNE